jgi:hypothetical protein
MGLGPHSVTGGSTDVSCTIYIANSTTGAPETAVEHNTSGIDLWYRREGAAKTSITEAALTALTDAHSDGGIEAIGNGTYRLDLPDAAVAAGVAGVQVGGTITGMVVYGPYITIDAPVNVTKNAGTAITSASGRQEVNLSHIAGSAVSTSTAQLGVNVVNAAGTAWGSGAITAASIATGAIDADAIADNAIDAGAIASDAITAAKIATGAITAAKFAAGAIDAAALATDAAQEIRNSITGGAYALDTDANGRIRIVDGTAAGEINTNAGAIALVDLVTLATTVTNLTNAATNGDLTATMKASVNTEVDAGIETYHLDHLLAVAYDPASKPGAADALLNELIGNDAGVSQFTANALELAPSGTGASAQSIVEAMFQNDSGETAASAVAGSAVYEIVNNAGGGSSDWTADQRTAIAAILGIPASGTTPEDPTTGILDTIRDSIAGLNNITAASVWAVGARTLTALDEDNTTIDLDAAIRAAVGLTSANLDTQIAALPTQAEITGGAYALNTDSGGSVRIVDGTGTGELNTSGGFIAGIAGTINTLDALDTAQDSQHATTQAAVTASAIRAAVGLASANLDTQLDALPTAAEITSAVFANAVETGITFLQLQRVIGAVLAGQIADAGTGTETFKAAANSGTTRVVYTVDASGNRSAVVITA